MCRAPLAALNNNSPPLGGGHFENIEELLSERFRSVHIVKEEWLVCLSLFRLSEI